MTHIPASPLPLIKGQFFSDTHLFHPLNGAADKHLQMLYSSMASQIYAVGDTFDFTELVSLLYGLCADEADIPECFEDVLKRIHIPDLEIHMRCIDVLLWKAALGVDITLITGNHDIGLDVLNGRTLFGIKCRTEAIYDSGCRRFLVEHGHMFDPAYFREFSGIYKIGSFFLDGGLWLDHRLSRLVPSFFKSFPISNTLKRIGKSYVRGFIDRAMDKAKEKGLDGIICGHIHKQDSRDELRGFFSGRVINHGVRYINCGDGLTHGTSVMNIYGDAQTGWLFQGPADIPAQASEILGEENPLHEFRAESLHFLQQLWEAHVKHVRRKVVNREQAFDGVAAELSA